MLLPGAGEKRGVGNCCSMGIEFQFGKMRKFYRSVAQRCEYSWHYWTVHLKIVKIVNFMLCVFVITIEKISWLSVWARVDINFLTWYLNFIISSLFFFWESCKLILEERKGGREDWKRNGGRGKFKFLFFFFFFFSSSLGHESRKRFGLKV